MRTEPPLAPGPLLDAPAPLEVDGAQEEKMRTLERAVRTLSESVGRLQLHASESQGPTFSAAAPAQAGAATAPTNKAAPTTAEGGLDRPPLVEGVRKTHAVLQAGRCVPVMLWHTRCGWNFGAAGDGYTLLGFDDERTDPKPRCGALGCAKAFAEWESMELLRSGG